MADDLLSLVDSTSERVQRDSLEFQSDIARGLMDASGGEITGFEVTRTDDDARGIHRTETVFDRAARRPRSGLPVSGAFRFRLLAHWTTGR